MTSSLSFLKVPSFDDFAAGMKISLWKSSGAIKDMTIMESVDFNKAAEIASKAAASYRPVGK